MNSTGLVALNWKGSEGRQQELKRRKEEERPHFYDRRLRLPLAKD
jgi:hypothetical protein